MSERARSERFIDKISFGDECWEWIGQRNNAGYGMFSIHTFPVLAHRYSYELAVGPIPRGMVIDHICRNKACVRPDHLEPVTHSQNNVRSLNPIENHKQTTHCPKGHQYIVFCRECDSQTHKRYYRKKKGKSEKDVSI